MSHYRPYPAYKASGVEWLGEVPEHWELKKIKWLASLQSGEFITSESIKPEGLYPVFGGNGLRGYTDEFTHDGRYVIIGRQGALCGNVNYSMKKFWASEHAVIVTPRESFNTTWMGELLRAMNLNQYSQSSAQPGLAVEKIIDLIVPVPPYIEQSCIAAMLDRETTRIDAMTAKKTRFIELLREKRQALVTQAVTKGLDPAAKMKDSGVEWLGEVPEHWEVKRLRFIAELNPSPKSNISALQDTEVSFLPMELISEDGSLNLEVTRRIGDVRNGYSYFEDGDLAFAKVTPCFENGKGAVMRGLVGGIGFGTTELTILRANKLANVDFLNYVVRSDRFRKLGVGAMMGAGGLKRVPDDFTRDFYIPLPDVAEQHFIASFLDRETTRLDTLISKTQQSLDLLKERRAALITAAVTGQIDLRENDAIAGAAVASGGFW